MSAFLAPSIAEGIATLIDQYQESWGESVCVATCRRIGDLEHVPRNIEPDVCFQCGCHVWVDSDLVEVCRERSMRVVPICLGCDWEQPGN